MFLAHFSNTPLHVLEEWPAAKIKFYYYEALSLFKKLKPTNNEHE